MPSLLLWLYLGDKKKEELLLARDASMPLNNFVRKPRIKFHEVADKQGFETWLIDFDEDMEINSDDSDDDLVWILPIRSVR